MNDAWLLYTHGDPLGTTRRFLDTVWNEAKIDKMLVASSSFTANQFPTKILRKPEQLSKLNPFKPLMTINTAKYLPSFIFENQKSIISSILRPCELRAYNEMSQYQNFYQRNLLTICFDCLGTYPSDEYQWYVERKGSNESLTQSSLQFARQGGIAPYRYRSACQMCSTPNANEADINIEVIGLPIRQYLIIKVDGNRLKKYLRIETITDGNAQFEANKQRDWILAKIVERNDRVRERIKNALADILPADVDDLITQFEKCENCRNCLDACPICEIKYPRRSRSGKYYKSDLIRWIISCVGCGMCEQVCQRHQPLTVIFSYLKQQLTNSVI